VYISDSIGSMLGCLLLFVQFNFQLFLITTDYFDAGRLWPPGGTCGDMLTKWLLYVSEMYILRFVYI